MNPKQLLLIFFLLSNCLFLSAQKIDWDMVTRDIFFKKNLTDLNGQLETAKKEALQQAQYGFAARCLYHQMLIADRKSEDSLYFRNSYFIDSFINNSSTPPLMQSIMLVLKARRIATFRYQFAHRNNKNLFSLPDTSIDYRNLDNNALDSLVQLYLEQAKAVCLPLKQEVTKDILWLTNNPLLFLFKPDFTDIIYAEQLNHAAANIYHNSNYHYEWLQLPAGQFIGLNNLPAGFNKQLAPMFTLYQRWANYHQQEPEKFYFIESLARQYFYENTFNEQEHSNNIYQAYLQQLTSSQYATVKAHGSYLLFMYWYRSGNMYMDNANHYEGYQSTVGHSTFDTSVRFNFVKAFEVLSQNNSLPDSFSYLKQRMQYLWEQVSKVKLSIQHKDNYLPGAAIDLHLNYKNLSKLHLKFVQLSNLSYHLHEDDIDRKILLSSKSFKTEIISLPAVKDFQNHVVNVNAGTLPLGLYAVLYSDSAINNDNSNFGYFVSDVSNIAAINGDERLFLLDRTTGMPLQNGKLYIRHLTGEDNNIEKKVIKTINAAGYVNIKEKDIVSAMAVFGKDSARISINEIKISNPNEVFNKSEEILSDFLSNNANLLLFTDRAIYRPGQTVHFKGILLTRNPETGERVVWNKQNVQLPLLKTTLNSEEKKLVAGNMQIFVKNAFDVTVDTIKVTSNEYGSFTGDFKLSEKAATGEWKFETDNDIEIDYENSGQFDVEEYKRPNFELKLKEPSIFLQMGDSFFVKAHARSFADAALNNVAVHYDITANFLHNAKDSITGEGTKQRETIIITDSTGHTDNNGALAIKVPGHFLKSYQFAHDDENFVIYSIHATAVDASGESHEETIYINLSSWPVKIDCDIKDIYERKKLGIISVTTSNEYSGRLKKQLEARIYKIIKKAKPEVMEWDDTDFSNLNNQWIYQVKNRTSENEDDDKQELIYQQTIDSNSSSFNFPKELLASGHYKMEILCRENGNISGKNSFTFQVYEQDRNMYPDTSADFYHLPVNSGSNGDIIKWNLGNRKKEIYSIYQAQYFSKTGRGFLAKSFFDIKKETAGTRQWLFTIPADAAGDILLTHVYIRNNKLYKKTETVELKKKATTEPKIIVERYRKRLSPGSKARFVVTIKTKNVNLAAELLTTMYDASLDRIKNHTWELPVDRPTLTIDDTWQDLITPIKASDLSDKISRVSSNNEIKPLWWLNPLDYQYEGSVNGYLGRENALYYNWGSLSADSKYISAVPFLRISPSASAFSMSPVTFDVFSEDIKIVPGTIKLGSYKNSFIILDGEIYNGDINAINPGLIKDGLILKGQDAVALYGEKAANGAIIISTKGPLQIPTVKKPAVRIRKNFSETAFFFPQVHADEDGYYSISFTMPESVTEWNWKMLAHTKDAKFVYAQKSIVTQLPMMVQPNMPRFLYQGDVINLQTRISNLDSTDISGTSNCKIEDAVTGQDITGSIVNGNKQNFSINKKSTGSIAYQLHIPNDLLHPLTIRVSARAGGYADGEEYTIPVLSKKVLVTQQVPFIFSSDTTIMSPSLPADAKPYGIGLYIQPKPQAALLHALPYLAFYPYGCAEQTFNKMLALSTALKISRNDAALGQSINQLQNKNQADSKAESLPEELSEQTMPWLQLNHQTKIHQQQLTTIFDSMATNAAIEKHWNTIASLQNADGGITWFPGGKSNVYISNYLLAGFGKLKNDSLAFFLNNNNSSEDFSKFMTSLIAYADNQFTYNMKRNIPDPFYLLARSYWLKDYPMPVSNMNLVDSVFTSRWKNIHSINLGEQAMLIISGLRYFGKENQHYQNALKQLASIRQLAIEDNTNGIRWKDMSNADDFNNTDEENIARLAMAFEETGDSSKTVAGVIQWLLNTGKEHHWSNTKATAAVINLLRNNQLPVTGTPITIKAVAKDLDLTATDNLISGSLTSFKPMQVFPAAIAIQKHSQQAASGGMSFYYFTATPPQNETTAIVKISKQYFRMNSSSKAWEAIDSSSVLKIADKIKTVISIDAAKPLKYVFIDEKRAAALEPADGSSGYEYGDACSYYKSVRDAGYQFFAELIPSGLSSISYESIVAQEGQFSNGMVSLQCMYQPQVRTYGNGIMVTVVK